MWLPPVLSLAASVADSGKCAFAADRTAEKAAAAVHSKRAILSVRRRIGISFLFYGTATPEIYTLSLPAGLPI